MQAVYCLILLTGAYPLWRAWRANRGTALEHAVLWAAAAWAGWLAAFAPGGEGQLGRYLALSLTGCAGVAVLGARPPHVGAWNFVVASLLAVLLLPVAQGWGEPRLNPPYLVFLAATVGVGVLNYLPTRLAPAALALGIGCGVELAGLCGLRTEGAVLAAGRCLAGISPWLAFACLRGSASAGSEFDRQWLDYRDRYGVVWGQRSREQFNRAAANAGWPVVLTWHGLESRPDGAAPDAGEVLAVLRAVLKRFGTADGDREESAR